MSEKAPIKPPRWAEGTIPPGDYPGAVEPNESLKDSGYADGGTPAAGGWNWVVQHFSKWLRHLEANQYFPQLDLGTGVASSVAADNALRDVAFGSGAGPDDTGMWAAVGQNSSTQGVIRRSLYGDTWTEVNLATFVPLGLAFGGNGVIVIVGYDDPTTPDGKILVLDDNSLSSSSGTAHAPAASFIFDVVWNGAVFVACGSLSGAPVLLRGDEDGDNWSSLTPVSWGAETGGFTRMLRVNARLLALGVDGSGDGHAQYSDDDGDTWNEATIETGVTSITSACWCWDEGTDAPSQVVLVTTSVGKLWRSTDGGATWTFADLEIGARFNGDATVSPIGTISSASGLAHCNGVTTMILRDDDAEQDWLLASFDLGLTWTAALRLPTNRYAWPAAATDGNRNVFVGHADAEDQYVILPTARAPMRLPKP